MPSTAKQSAAITLYGRLMEEAKVRLDAIRTLLAGQAFIGPIKQEFCYLQLRMLCELIALGCLTAHGDIEATTRLHKEWQADKIISALSKLSPTFFPIPIKMELLDTSTRRRSFTLMPAKVDGLDKPKLIQLYNKCGDVLHRGNLKRLLSDRAPIIVHLPDVARWANQVTHTLNHHAITLNGGNQMIICHMVDENGLVSVAFSEAAKPSAPAK